MIFVASEGRVKVDLLLGLFGSLRVFEDHMIVFIRVVLLHLLFLTLAPDFKGLGPLEEHLGRLRVRRRNLGRNVVIPQIDDPIQIVFGDLRLSNEVLELSDVAIHELFGPRLALLLLFLRHEYNGRMEVICNQYPISSKSWDMRCETK